MCSFFLYSFRSLCIGGKLGEWKVKENFVLEVIEGDIGVFVIFCMVKEDIGFIMVDWLMVFVCWVVL